MNERKQCPICGGRNMEAGVIHSTGKLHFRPEHAKFLKMKTANVDVKADLCLDCGHISLTGDVETVKGLTEQESAGTGMTRLEPVASPQDPAGIP